MVENDEPELKRDVRTNGLLVALRHIRDKAVNLEDARDTACEAVETYVESGTRTDLAAPDAAQKMAAQKYDLDPLEFWCDLAEVLGHERPVKADVPTLVSEVKDRLASDTIRQARREILEFIEASIEQVGKGNALDFVRGYLQAELGMTKPLEQVRTEIKQGKHLLRCRCPAPGIGKEYRCDDESGSAFPSHCPCPCHKEAM